MRVEDAHGQAPSIPFWLGEAPGRSDALSSAVGRLRLLVEQSLDLGSAAAASRLVTEVGLDADAASQITEYLCAGRAALLSMPSQDTIVFERFFDESGGMQLVIHSPFGSRINRAWGLSLRKRFCRTFNFELQAAATEDHIVLSLTHAHSFELAEVARYLHSNSVRQVLIQALCAAPMFGVRWRWVAGIALALPRFRGGKKVPPQIARMNAEDLLAAVFPDQVACAENLPGEIEVPDHPLVRQTVRDCLEEAMDVRGFEAVLRRLECGEIRVIARDLTQPSPLALEALNARPYAYLDDAPLEERRAQAVMARRWIDTASAGDLGRLDVEAIERVRAEAWPDASTADELCDALSWLGYLTDAEVTAHEGWRALIEVLAGQGRLLELRIDGSGPLWIAADRRAAFAPWPPQTLEPLVEIVRGRLEGLGPVTEDALTASMGIPAADVGAACRALETEGFALRGRFTPGLEVEWCERRLLARIHRYTVKRLRAEIEPVQARDFLRFLFDWQHLRDSSRLEGPDAVAAVLSQLEGFEAPAGAWESEILAGRIAHYEPQWLDEHCRAGRFVWTRLASRRHDADSGAGPVRSAPIILLPRRAVPVWSALTQPHDVTHLSAKPRAVLDFLHERGASFFDDIADGVRLLPVEVEDALGDLVSLGLVNSDSFGGLRALLIPTSQRVKQSSRVRRGRRLTLFGMADAGRWTLVRRESPPAAGAPPSEEAVEQVVRSLLRRWGVIFWKLLSREADWLPTWRAILSCCRRLEARGEIRGGRFIAGFAGEQYATLDAVALLRKARDAPAGHEYVSVSGADPLNLAGIVTPGARLPSLAGNRLLYRDGLPVAWFAGGDITYLVDLDPRERNEVQTAIFTRATNASVFASMRRSVGEGLDSI